MMLQFRGTRGWFSLSIQLLKQESKKSIKMWNIKLNYQKFKNSPYVDILKKIKNSDS